jgi:predicted NBD/HSP70 family sugar kinase
MTSPAVSGSAAEALRALDRQRILAAARSLGAASRADLGQATGLSRGTVASIVNELCRDGTLRLAGEPSARAGARGRPPALLSLAPPSGLALVADIGHRHARVVVGQADGTLIEERIAAFPPDPGPADSLAVAARLVTEVVGAQRLTPDTLTGAVLSLPASLDPDGRPLTPRYRGLEVARLAGLAGLGVRVSVGNDANLAALGEAAFGAGRGLSDFLYVKMSRGIGAGLVLGGRLYQGSRGMAGNVGHLRVRDDGARCRCGNRGCLETLVSAQTLVDALRGAHGNQKLGLADLLRLAADGDPEAEKLAMQAGQETGKVLAAVINAFNPATVLVGGCLSPLGKPLLEGLRQSIARYGQPVAVTGLNVLRATCGQRAEVLGGLAVAHDLVATTAA